MAETLRTHTDKTLLTRREIRKFFRVNELTIDRWMDRGSLMQVGEIPGEAGSPTKAVFAVLEDKLIEKLRARFESKGAVDLEVDRLPRDTRQELTDQASENSEKAPEPRSKDEAEPSPEAEPEPSPEAEPEPSPEAEPEPKSEVEAELRSKEDRRTIVGSRVKSKSATKKKTKKRRKKKRKSKATKEETRKPADGEPPDMPSPEEEEVDSFAALQTAAEASAYPELAEALWDEETLGALHEAAETLAAEADRLSELEPSTTRPPLLAGESDEANTMAEPIDGLGTLMAYPTPPPLDPASRELETAGIDLEEEEDRGPQVIDEDQALDTWSAYGGDDLAKERLLLQAELAEVKSLQQANLERMEARLANIENLIENLGLGRAQDLNIETTLEEIRGNVVVNESRRDILATSMSMISDGVQDLRTYVATANKTALATARGVQELSEKLAKYSGVRSFAKDPASGNGHHRVAPVLVLGVGVLILTWTLALYLKTGNFYVALAGVVLANLSACATILLGRTEND